MRTQPRLCKQASSSSRLAWKLIVEGRTLAAKVSRSPHGATQRRSPLRALAQRFAACFPEGCIASVGQPYDATRTVFIAAFAAGAA